VDKVVATGLGDSISHETVRLLLKKTNANHGITNGVCRKRMPSAALP
jgi:hypothetical protein